MMKKAVVFIVCILLIASPQSFSQTYDGKVQTYIDQWKNVAIEEQLRSGIPASITLAQGILETGAGTSELCTNAQNHFGIKCKNTWVGDTYTYTDDAKDECFRKYNSALNSYKDHSDFLRQNKRYATLFFIPVQDYSSWAKGLKRCGYATNPHYASKLIETIEKYHLTQYTEVALAMYQTANGNPEMLASVDENARAGEYIPDERVNVPLEELEDKLAESIPTYTEGKPDGIDYYTVTKRNGINGFYARKGDMLLEYAIRNRVRYSKLLEINDLFDEPLKSDMFIYLDKKNKTGQEETYSVKEGESLQLISQEQGMQLQALRNYNHLAAGEEPMPGSILYLKSTAPDKPNISTGGSYHSEKDAIVTREVGGNNDYIETVNSNAATNVEEEELSYNNDNFIDNKPTEQVANIANEQAVDEVYNAPPPQSKREKAEKEMDELDRLKAKLDQSVYTQPDPIEDTSDDPVVDRTKPVNTYENENINADANPDAALKKHMSNVKNQGREYTPKSNVDKTIRSKDLPATVSKPKAPAAKPVAAKTPAKTTSKTSAKKPIAKSSPVKKPTATSKTATSKKTVPVAKASSSAKKPTTSKTTSKSAPSKTTTTKKTTTTQKAKTSTAKAPAKKPAPKKK